MTSITALKTGNWSDSTVWPGGTFPGASDDVFSGGFTVTINQDITVLSLNSNGGGFSVTAAPRTINANIVAGTTTCLTPSHTSGNLSVVGNVTGGTGSGIHYNATGTGTLSITGNVTGGTSGYGIYHNTGSAGAIITITGNVTGSAGITAIHMPIAGSVLYVTGSVTGGSGGYGINAAVAGQSVTVTGNVTGGSASNIYGISNGSSGTVTVNGNVTGGSVGIGILNSSTGVVIVAGTVIGNQYGPGGVHATSAPGISSPNGTAVCRVLAIQYGPYGQSPTAGAVKITPDSANNRAQFIRYDTGATLTITDTGQNSDYPTAANVRYGTSYKYGDLTGTCRVPTASQTASGVLVDATTGTAVLTAAAVSAAVWDEARSGHTTAGTFGKVSEWASSQGISISDVQTALTNQGYTTTRAGYLDTLNGLVAAIWDRATSAITTAGSIGKVIKDNLDATISSRLASASYTAPDNATISTLSTNVSTLLGRLGAFTGSGVNTVLGMLKALGSKSATTPTDMGGTYDASTDSQEAAIDNAVGGATPAQLWTYASRTLTQSASQVNAAVSGSDITILRGDRVMVNLTGIGSLVGRTKLWITVKWSASQSDGEAVIQAEETAGLLTLNGASYATATDSVITVTDAATGALTWVLKEAATRQLSAPVAGMVYDIQILTSDGPITRAAGSVNTTADVTRAVT